MLRVDHRTTGTSGQDAEALIREARRRQRRRRFAIGAAILAAVGLLALIITNGAGHRGNPAVAPNPTPSGQPFVDANAFHGHGHLAFVSLGALFVLDGMTDRVAAVSSPADGARDPQFSPNGRWLAYTYGSGNVGLANADGTSPRTISSHGERVGWLPTGELLVANTIYDVSDNGTVTNVGSAPDDLVAWSSDGNRYVFVSPAITNGPDQSFDGDETIDVADSITGTRTTWWHTPVSFKTGSGFHGDFVDGVVVLPHDLGILYWVDPDHSASIPADGMSLFYIASPGATPTQLGVTVGRPVSVGSGGVLAIGAGENRYAWMTRHVELCSLPVGSCAPVQMPADRLALEPSWAPDGTTLAFVGAAAATASDTSQQAIEQWYSTHQIWLQHAGTTEPAPVPNTTGASSPVWSSDSRSLLYVADNALWLIADRGSAPAKVASPLFPPTSWPSFYGQVDWVSQFSWSTP